MEPLRQRLNDDFKYEPYDREYNKDKKRYQNNNTPYQLTLKAHQARLIACNGDCGSNIAKIIDDIIKSKVLFTSVSLLYSHNIISHDMIT